MRLISRRGIDVSRALINQLHTERISDCPKDSLNAQSRLKDAHNDLRDFRLNRCGVKCRRGNFIPGYLLIGSRGI